MDFPKGFIWGSATAAHQVGGNNTNNDIWLLEHAEHSMFKEPSLDACDHFHRYPEDIKLLADLGFVPIDSRSNGPGLNQRKGIF